MSDPWINRLEITGPTEDVAAAGRAMEPARSPRSRSRRRDFSFRALYAYLGGRCRICADCVCDPYDVSIEREKPPQRGLVREVYRFQQVGFEPDDLLAALSARHPRLCLVLGWVAPCNGEAASKLFHGGRELYFRLSNRRMNAIYPDIDDEDEDDGTVFRLMVEADWVALEEVVARWSDRVRQLHNCGAGQRPMRRKTWEISHLGEPVAIDSMDHAHYSADEYSRWELIGDAEAAARVLRKFTPSEGGVATFAIPDGSYVECVGAKRGCSVEVREYGEDGSFRHWAIGKGPLTGKRMILRGPDSRRTVDASRILDRTTAREVVRHFLRSRSTPGRFVRTEITDRAKRKPYGWESGTAR